jgi:hypothetical protein
MLIALFSLLAYTTLRLLIPLLVFIGLGEWMRRKGCLPLFL